MPTPLTPEVAREFLNMYYAPFDEAREEGAEETLSEIAGCEITLPRPGNPTPHFQEPEDEMEHT